MRSKIQRLIGAGIILVMLTGCGEYGPLYMPTPKAKAAQLASSHLSSVKGSKGS